MFGAFIIKNKQTEIADQKWKIVPNPPEIN